jgi:hypothetical protein
MVVVCSTFGCVAREVSKVDPNPIKEERVSVLGNRDLDLLFVIDNSGSMASEQQSLRDNFSRIIQALDGAEGLPSIHIGVVTTDVGACGPNPDAGKLIDAGCAGASENYLIDLDDGMGGRTKNYTGTIEDAFSCLADVGDEGCGFEQALEAMKRGLQNGEDIGFLRDDAYLGIVFIGDEDDCSTVNNDLFKSDGDDDLHSPLGPLDSFRCFEFGVECDGAADPRVPGPRTNCRPRENSPYMTEVPPYADFLRDLKPFDDQLLLATIQGAIEPVEVLVGGSGNDEHRDLAFSCGMAGAEAQAVPPVRLYSFLDQAPADATRASICDEDLSDAVQQIANFFGSQTRGCLGDLHDTDPDTAGIQPECNVAMVQAKIDDTPVETLLPACDNAGDPEHSGNLPCFQIAVNPECLEQEHKLAVAAYFPEGEVPPATRIVTRCLLE